MKRSVIKIAISLLFFAGSMRSWGDDTVWSIAVLDQLIAEAPTNATTVLVGDMTISLKYLEGWRNKLAGGPQPKSAFYAGFVPWIGGNVYYAFDASVSPANQKVFRDCCAEWATFANLRFIPRTVEPNYILVTNNPSLGGGQSAVGMAGGAQLLQLGPYAWNHSTICHELGHALGMCHEHQRSDRTNFVTINTNNILSGHLADFVLLTGSTNKGAYDFLSVMHYARNNFSVSPNSNTIVPLSAYSQYLDIMGQRFDPVLSAADRAGMAQMYGAGPTISSVVTNTLDSGPGSLRTALYYAYDHPGTTITFNIPVTDPGFSNNVFNILPTDTFPGLWNATTLDGTTEPTNSNPAGPEILLNGALCWTPAVYPNGLRFRGTNNTARGFVIHNFPSDGVLFNGTNCTGNTLSGCYLGVDPTGTFAVTNGLLPVEINSGATGNTIGGATAAARNIISGSFFQGITLHDAGTSNNVVKGNYIGLNGAGTAALPNNWNGVELYASATGNTIGGTNAGEGNVISGNGNYGVSCSQAGVNGNRVFGNWIGLNAAGTAALPNAYAGAGIFGGASSNSIGGFGAGMRNVISGNANDGVLVSDSNSVANVVAGNYVGLNPAGTAAIPNTWSGVDIYNGSALNTVASNVVSGNGNYGVIVRGNFNSIWGNLAGLNAAGTAAIGNGYAGISLYYPSVSNVVGGVTAAARNVISGNNGQGIFLYSAPVTGNLIQGNFIGLNAAGTAALANAWSGIELYAGPASNTIGGLGGARNFISGNGNYGISINNGSSNNSVLGNTIGLNATNGAAVPNNWAGAICFAGAVGNLIGGVTPGAANLIASNNSDGVQVSDVGTTNVTVRGNSIFGNIGRAIALYNTGNAGLAAPSLTSAVVTTNTAISGSYTGVAGRVFRLDFHSDAPPAGSAQAQTYLGSISVTGTGASAAFTTNLGVRLPSGRAVTASATDPAGNTSQLSTGIAATMTSTPNDGIPNAWRALWFGGIGTTTNSQSASFADPDGDGINNYAEFLAGTNPTNAASAFRLIAQNPASGTNAVALNSANGIVYRVLYRDDLTGGSWNILADQLIGTGTNIFLTDPAATALSRRFYRGQVLW